jgi:hypothetical protein
VQLAAQRTGIPADHIVWATSHTHTGPIAEPEVYLGMNTTSDLKWLEKLPEQFAQAVQRADAAKRPALMSRLRGYCSGVAVNRRLRFKDGRELNHWLLHAGEEEVQCLGAAGPVDPEVGILCFDGEDGVPIAVLWHYTVHANANFGPRFSADYPTVVVSRLRERYGTGVVSIFMPGHCGDVNPILKYREIGNRLADVIIEQLEKRTPRQGEVALAAIKKEITVPAREFRTDERKRLLDSQWAPDVRDWFVKQEQFLRERNEREITTLLQAWRIGEVGFASLPGEPFIEWGVKIKAESPFPWTYPVELGGDYVGYLVTEQAYRAGGYESLHSWVGRVSPQGVGMMVSELLELLRRLWKEHPA